MARMMPYMAVSGLLSQSKLTQVMPIECSAACRPKLGLNIQRQATPVTINDTASG
ncbi:hypothetical protein D3C72_2535630 [compost metagenome]